MAVDTRNKRASMMSFGRPFITRIPLPDGTIDAADRAMLLHLYHGIALSAPAVGLDPLEILFLNTPITTGIEVTTSIMTGMTVKTPITTGIELETPIGDE